MTRRVRAPFIVDMVPDEDGVAVAQIGNLLRIRVTHPEVGGVDHRGNLGVDVEVLFGDDDFWAAEGWTIYAPKASWADAAIAQLDKDIARLSSELFEADEDDEDEEDWDAEQKSAIGQIQELYGKPLFS